MKLNQDDELPAPSTLQPSGLRATPPPATAAAKPKPDQHSCSHRPPPKIPTPHRYEAQGDKCNGENLIGARLWHHVPVAHGGNGGRDEVNGRMHVPLGIRAAIVRHAKEVHRQHRERAPGPVDKKGGASGRAKEQNQQGQQPEQKQKSVRVNRSSGSTVANEVPIQVF